MSKFWPTLPPLPQPGQRVIEANGLMNRDWYLWHLRADTVLRELVQVGLADLADVDLTVAPADTEQLTFVSADSAWKAGAA